MSTPRTRLSSLPLGMLGVALAIGCGHCGSSSPTPTNAVDAGDEVTSDAPDTGAPGDTAVGDVDDADATASYDDLADILEPIRKEANLPALAAAVFDSEKPLALGAVGVRKVGDPTAVTRFDRFHLGSDTKAMTATLTALLVEDKTVSWSTKLADAFPDWTLDAGYRDVTLTMLLSHRGGAPGDVPADIWAEMWKPGVSMDQRRVAVQAMLGQPPVNTPGTAFLYANAGYMMVGAALERATSTSWEAMMQKRVFDALGMAACGFGAPATKDMVDQPWGHTVTGSTVKPVPPQPAGDNPPSLGPAGTVNCSLLDWGKFLQVHLKGARGLPTIVSADSITKMHTAWPGGDYALGWIVTNRSWGGGTVLTHSGSNTMFFATVWIAPAKNRIYVVATNRADTIASTAVDKAFGPLIAKY